VQFIYIGVMGISITLHMGMIATCFCVTWNVYGAYDVSNIGYILKWKNVSETSWFVRFLYISYLLYDFCI